MNLFKVNNYWIDFKFNGKYIMLNIVMLNRYWKNNWSIMGSNKMIHKVVIFFVKQSHNGNSHTSHWNVTSTRVSMKWPLLRGRDLKIETRAEMSIQWFPVWAYSLHKKLQTAQDMFAEQVKDYCRWSPY